MVKYGKEYRKLQLDEWKKYYLNYKLLKQKIKSMKKTLFKELKIKEGPRPSLLSTPLIPEDLDDKEKMSSLYKDEKGEQLKEFIELLLQEFKKCYSFFIGIEKVLIKKMNTHLYTQTSYSTYSISELSKEIKSLSLTVYLAKCLNAFINDIMMAIKKILKKFDKNFSNIFGIITPHLILQLLSKRNSELEHIIQFKVIDEIATIAESNIKELKKYFDQNNENSKNNKDEDEYKNSFLQKYEETKKYIQDIGELIYFKTQYKDWTDNMTRRTTMKKGYKIVENDIFNPILSSSYYKDNLLDKFLSTNEAFTEAKKIQSPISNENKRNIMLILLHTFFYNSLFSCIFPVLYYYEYIRSFNEGQPILNDLWFVNIFLFLIVGSTYFAQFLSIFFFYNYTSRKKIKLSYLLSYGFIFIGSVLYIISIISSQGHLKVRALILVISRSLIGLGSNPMIGKKYITIYSPRYSLPVISKIYLIVELLGFILGPAIASVLFYLQIDEVYCIYNCIGYYGSFGSLIIFILYTIFFISPYNENFSIVKTRKKGNLNKSNSQTTQPIFEDIEDSQDKEFYKLQKEKKEKKNDKSNLEATKSDEIHIEINDNEQSKYGNNKTINNTVDSNAEEEKGQEDNDFYKIMEKAGDILGQNEIAENYYNNVDTGRYSDLDITKEKRDSINEIKAKLDEYQERSNFTYINMIPRTLDDIILKEQKTFGNMNKNLLIMLILLLFNNLIKENLIVHSSYFMLFKVYKNGTIINEAKEIINKYNNTNSSSYIDINNMFDNIYSFNSNDNNNSSLGEDILNHTFNNKGDLQIICLLVSGIFLLQILSLLFIRPFYKINLTFKNNLIILMIISVVLMIPLSIEFFFSRIYLYAPIVSIDIFIHKMIEIICSCYLVNLIPPKWKYSHIRASSLPIYLMTLGKIGGCVFCISSFSETTLELNQHILTATAFTIYGLIGLFIFKSKNFRVSTLSRILANKALEQNFN